jgi:DNA-binding XRE family transcriptional regulator
MKSGCRVEVDVGVADSRARQDQMLQHLILLFLAEFAAAAIMSHSLRGIKKLRTQCAIGRAIFAEGGEMADGMSPKQFRRWRKELGLSQKGAARALGLKPRIVQYYEKGEREGKKVEVPLSVRLACWALQQGVADFNGSDACDADTPATGRRAKSG